MNIEWGQPVTVATDRFTLAYRGLPPNLMCVDQYLRILPDGGWAIFFTTGGPVEPDIRNYIAVSRSSDQGKTWSPIETVAKFPDKGATLTEVLVHNGAITLFASLHAGKFDHWHTCLITSMDSGKTWSQPQPFTPLPRRTFVRNRVFCSWGEWVFPFQAYPVVAGDPDASIWSDGSFKQVAVGALITADQGRTWAVSATATGVDWAENNIVELSYWFNWQFSNCRDLSSSDVGRAPARLKGVDPSDISHFVSLAKELMKDYRKHSKIYRRVTNDVVTEFDSFYPMLSKPVLDRIDAALAKHLGITDEELDFIINYDIKYRMGGADDGEED